MKTMRKVLCFVMAVVMISVVMSSTAEAVTKAKLNKKKVILTITDSKKSPSTTLKIKGVSNKVAKKAKWSTSQKSVATVKKGKVTAKKAGKATITCKVKGKKYNCKVTVVDKRPALNAEVTISKASDTEYHYNTSQYKTEDGFVESLDGCSINTYCASNLNKITVKYNGIDITKNVKFEIEDPYPYGVVINKKTIIDKDGVIWLKHRKGFKVTIVYKGMKKTLELKTESVKFTDYICRCGEYFRSYEELEQHQDAVCLPHSLVDGNGIYHDGFWFGDVIFVDVIC